MDCDRYFTGPSLVEFMLSKNIYVTETVMKNRIPAAVAKLSDDRTLQKRERGACDVVVTDDEKMSVVK